MLNKDLTHEMEVELVAAWKAGDRRAGDRLLTRHVHELDRYFAARVDRGCAEDLRQKTLIRVGQAIALFRGESSFRTLLFAVARFVLIDHLRKRTRRGRFETDQASLAELEGAVDAAVSLDAESGLLLAALRKLPFDQQELIELHCVHGFTFKEIVAMRGSAVTEEKLRKQLFVARKKLEWLLDRSRPRLRGIDDDHGPADHGLDARLRRLDEALAAYLIAEDGVEAAALDPVLSGHQPR